MELDLFFSNSKWEILRELSKKPSSPMELSQVFGTSVANISQQLRLMEAMGMVDKTKVKNSEKGKPRMIYEIKNDIIYLVRLGKNFAKKQYIKPEPQSNYIFNVISTQNKKDQFYLLRFFFEHSDLLSSTSIGLFKNTENSVELFIVTEELEKAREKLSKKELENPNGEKKKVTCWAHNEEEIKNGLTQNDPHFINLIKESEILLDNNLKLHNFKSEAENNEKDWWRYKRIRLSGIKNS